MPVAALTGAWAFVLLQRYGFFCFVAALWFFLFCCSAMVFFVLLQRYGFFCFVAALCFFFVLLQRYYGLCCYSAFAWAFVLLQPVQTVQRHDNAYRLLVFMRILQQV
jgi:hypothetical protein